MNDPRHEAPRDDAPITQWVSAFLAGDRDCENRLFSHIYQELRGVPDKTRTCPECVTTISAAGSSSTPCRRA